MKLKMLALTALTIFVLEAQAQPPAQAFGFGGGAGLSVISDTLWFNILLNTELTLGKFGVGLNVPLRFNFQQGIRKADWDAKRDYAKLIRYIRFGHPFDPFYIRIGALEHVTLGHGFIVYDYNNRLREDDYPKIGMDMHVDLGRFGMQLINSDFGRWGLIAMRGFVRPMPQSVPIIKNLEFGLSYAQDADPDERKATTNTVWIWGMDAGLPIIRSKFLNFDLYADYAKIFDHGDGATFGLNFVVPNMLGIFQMGMKLEKRQLNEHFVPSYFDALYEIDKFEKESMLDTVTRRVKGTFGQLSALILNEIQIAGDYFHDDKRPCSGILKLWATTGKLIPGVTANFGYFKDGIETLRDVFTVNERSVFIGEGGYRINPYITLYFTMRRTFRYNPETDEYEPQDEFGTRLEFNWQSGG
ncbi:MAG: hypothetical protein DRQ10_04100 [Candidatus Hydrothermota bacterium]|nr:MAG: hypothetical protein DRQ10_04100 [Candidatus Hydrothermae bacterium]